MILINCYNYRKLSRQTFRQVTGQKDTKHNNIFLSNSPVEILLTFSADSAHLRFYNKRLIKHTLFIPRVNNNVLAKQIGSLVNSCLERRRKNLKKFFYFFIKLLGAKADPRYKRTRVITRQVLTGLTCTINERKSKNVKNRVFDWERIFPLREVPISKRDANN